MSGQIQKIGPRKFSEKIALLNKKEAEANAKFEQIIKEVQATKSYNQPGISSESNTWNQLDKSGKELLKSNSREELEEVFESLIKCVGQYEQELERSRAQVFGSTQVLNGGYHMIDESSKHSGHPINDDYIVESNLESDQNSDNLQLNNSSIETPESQVITNRQDDLIYDDSLFDSQYTSQTERLKLNDEGDLTSFNVMRSRVTSFGSANVNQVMNKDNQCAWQDTSVSYLSEPCERSWHKSSSDPALHVPLKIDCDNRIQENKFVQMNSSQNYSTSPLMNHVQHRFDDSNVSVRYVRNQQGDVYMETCKQISGPPQIQVNLPFQEVNVCQVLQDQVQPHRLVNLVEESDNIELDASNLPGIQICPFEEENPTQISVCSIENNIENHVNDSLQDVSGLDTGFVVPAEDHCVSLGVDKVLTYDCHENHPADQINSFQLDTQHQVSSIFYNQMTIDSSMDQAKGFSNQRGLSESRKNMIDPDTSSWSGTVAPSASVGYLSYSTSGLTNTGQTGSANNNLGSTDNLNSIMRSHSHNSIDYLTRQKTSSIHSYNRNEPYPLQKRAHQSAQYLQSGRPIGKHHRHQLSHFVPSIIENSIRHCNSNISIRPQFGSTSPIDSSSNLASPQSEQNSPGSCGNEQADSGSNIAEPHRNDLCFVPPKDCLQQSNVVETQPLRNPIVSDCRQDYKAGKTMLPCHVATDGQPILIPGCYNQPSQGSHCSTRMGQSIDSNRHAQKLPAKVAYSGINDLDKSN